VVRENVIGQGRYGVICEGLQYEEASSNTRRLAVKEVEIDATLSYVEQLVVDSAGLAQAIEKVLNARYVLDLLAMELAMLYRLRDRFPDAHLCYPINHGERAPAWS
jgi:hypothetical protein